MDEVGMKEPGSEEGLAMASPRLLINLLGSIDATVAGDGLAIGGRQPRLGLAALALAVPGPVSVDGLIDALWDDPPTSAVKTVRSVVSRLRSALGSEVIESSRFGYRLAVPPEAIDAQRLVAVSVGSQAGEFVPDQVLVEAAVSLSAEPFGSLSLSRRLEGEKRRLVEHQIGLRDLVAELWIDDADFGRAVPFVEELIVENPLSERRWELLARALAGAGRRGEALRSVQRAREHLVNQLGVEPGSGLRDLEQAILNDQPIGSAPGAGESRLTGGASRQSRRGALPDRRSGFVGRDANLSLLEASLPEGALVSVVGPGGVGKTSLAVEVGWRVAGTFPDGVWFCDLATIADPSAVPRVVAAVLNIAQQDGAGPVQSIVDALESDRSLIILDNCEHVVDEVATVIRAVMDGCARTSILVTSRERLELVGELVVPLDPLEPSTDAVDLFTIRATEADPSYNPDHHHVEVVELCAHLDGLPLAIELAAARSRSLTPGDLLMRMEDRFQLLKSRRRDIHARHRTLRGTVAWSYDLLGPEHQMLFDRLSVFAGVFDLNAVLAVCADDGLNELTIVDGLEELVAQSLVIARQHQSGIRYRLLETLRQFGTEQSEQKRRSNALRHRHAIYYASRSYEAQARYEGPDCLRGVADFELIWDNLREARIYSSVSEEHEILHQLLESTTWFAFFSGYDEVGDWANEASSASNTTLSLGVAATFALNAGEYARAAQLGTAGIAAAVDEPQPGSDFCYWALEVASMHAGMPDQCVEHMRHHENAARSAGDLFSLAICHGARVVWIAATGPEDGILYLDLALEAAAEVGSQALDAIIGVYAAGLFQARGELEAADQYREEALKLARASHNRRARSLALAWRAVRAPRADRDLIYLDTLIEIRELKDWMGIQVVFESLAAHLAATDPRQSGFLLGYLERHCIGHGGLAVRRKAALQAIGAMPQGADWLSVGADTPRTILLDGCIQALEGRIAQERHGPTGTTL
ncbi:MAG: BTAD domain-containing putative transcriptional regulator [Acidimicrobiales bacterium]